MTTLALRLISLVVSTLSFRTCWPASFLSYVGFVCSQPADDQGDMMQREEGVNAFTLLHHDLNICTNSVSHTPLRGLAVYISVLLTCHVTAENTTATRLIDDAAAVRDGSGHCQQSAAVRRTQEEGDTFRQLSHICSLAKLYIRPLTARFHFQDLTDKLQNMKFKFHIDQSSMEDQKTPILQKQNPLRCSNT